MESSYKAYREEQRKIRKALLLKRSVILSYLHIVCTKKVYKYLQYKSGDILLDFLITTGRLDDLIDNYYLIKKGF